MTHATLLGIPLDLGAENLGVDIGPNAFRYLGIREKLESSGFHVSDSGNIHCRDRQTLSVGNPKLKYLEEIVRVSEDAAKTVKKILERKKEHVIILGGDHSSCLGPISGASVSVKHDLGLFYLDAHGDMNTEKTTMTGNIHGMHLASLLGYGNKHLVNILDSSVKIQKDNMLHIGGHDLDPGEIALIQKEKLNTYTITDILSNGLDPLFHHIDAVNKNVRNVWVSLDLDVIDSMYAPGSGMLNRAGLTYREVTTICQYIGEHSHVLGVDVVEYNPLRDIEGKTVELAIELIAKLFGLNYSWYATYLQSNKLKK